MRLHGPVGYVQPLAYLRIGQSLCNQVSDDVLGGREAGPAELRPAAGAPVPEPQTLAPQHRRRAGVISRGAQAFVDADGPVQQRAAATQAIVAGKGGTRILAGLREVKRAGRALVGINGSLQDLGIVLDQPPAAT